MISTGRTDTKNCWQELISAIKRYSHVVPVGGTNSTNLLMAFYTGETYICQGRDITQEEYEKGERVCLISRDMVSDGDEKREERLESGRRDYAAALLCQL